MKLHRIYLASFANGLWFSVAHAQDAEAYLRPIGERGVGGGLPTWVAILVLAVVGLGLLNSFGARGFTHMI